MALVDLKTDLKSLKFESGLNRKPLIVKDIDKEGGRNSGLAVQGILAAKRLDDTIRMAKLVIAKPGITHVVKQALGGFISAVDKKQLYSGDQFKLGKELLDEGKDILLTALTNIGQTPLNGLGLHLYKGSKEFGGEDVRSYIKRTYGTGYSNEAGKRIIKAGHSNQHSAGIKKSKKLPLSSLLNGDVKKYGRIDYTGEVKNASVVSDAINTEPELRMPAATFDDQLDMIPFGFSMYDQVNPINFRFRAFLDSFSDTFTGNWNSTRYLGNPQNFRTYDGFDRQLSMGFKIAALTRAELIPIYRKLNLLVSSTAPNYDIDGLFMRGTWCKITVGDYLKQTPCTISSIGLSWQQDYPWEIKQDKDEENVIMVPHVLDVNLSAVLEHDFIPQAGLLPYIGTNGKDQPINSEDGKPEEANGVPDLSSLF